MKHLNLRCISVRVGTGCIGTASILVPNPTPRGFASLSPFSSLMSLHPCSTTTTTHTHTHTHTLTHTHSPSLTHTHTHTQTHTPSHSHSHSHSELSSTT